MTYYTKLGKVRDSKDLKKHKCQRLASISISKQYVGKATHTKTWDGWNRLVRRVGDRRWRRSWAAALAYQRCPGVVDFCALSDCFWFGSGDGRTHTRTKCPTVRVYPGSGVWGSSNSWKCAYSTDSLVARLSLQSWAGASPTLQQTALLYVRSDLSIGGEGKCKTWL